MSLKERIEKIRARIAKAANGKDVKMIAVTKNHSAHYIQEALSEGIDIIGENRVQEAEEKLPRLEGQFTEFHFIGHLQTNKIRKLLPLNPTLIHSLDKITTAVKLNAILQEVDRHQDVLIEVNTSGEDSKEGIQPEELLPMLKELSPLTHLHVKGLMTIAPFTGDEQEIRKSFRLLRGLYDQVAGESIENIEMKYLSMGMSHDFEIAIEEGANIVRIGTAIFGSRY